MSDFGWGALAVALLVIVGLIFRFAWHGGLKPNGLKDEIHDRVAALENEIVAIWKELKRQGNRWIP